MSAPERRAVTVGYVAFDERRMQQVQPRAEGWVQGLAVRAMGETVQKGQLLFTLYSPMLESAQQEYRDAQRIGNRTWSMLRASDCVRSASMPAPRDGWRVAAAPRVACRSMRRSAAS